MAKSKALKWLDNYWYHYKWPTLIVIFFLVVSAVCITQCSTKTEDDVTVMYAGPDTFTANELLEISSAFTQMLPKDYNNDGEKLVEISQILLMTEEQYEEYTQGGSIMGLNRQTLTENHNNFSNQIFAGECVILMLDPNWYKEVKEAGGLCTLKEVLGTTPDYAIDDYAVYLKDTPFAKYFSAFSLFSEDTILCVRNMSTASNILSYDKQKEKYENQLDMFRTIMSFEIEK